MLLDGAIPLVVADHLIRDLGLVPKRFIVEGDGDGLTRAEALSPEAQSPAVMLSPAEARVVALCREEGEVSLNRLCEKLSISPALAAGLVSVLEIKGILTTALGKVFLAG